MAFLVTLSAAVVTALPAQAVLPVPDALSVIAGDGSQGSTPPSLPGTATSAPLHHPSGVAVDDATGDVYFSDVHHRQVYKVTTAGVMSLVAGDGAVSPSSPNPGPALGAHLKSPRGLAVDAAGNLYIADFDWRVVFKVTSGTLSVAAGLVGGSGAIDPTQPATASPLRGPTDVDVDSAGNLYIADTGNPSVIRVDHTNQHPAYIVSDSNSYGLPDPLLPASVTPLMSAEAVAIREVGGVVYVYLADKDAAEVLKVNTTTDTFSIIAGTGTPGAPDPAHAASLSSLHDPRGVAVDADGNVYIADGAGYVVERVTPADTLTVVAGSAATPTYGLPPSGVLATSVDLGTLEAVAVSAAGALHLADADNAVVEAIRPGTAPGAPTAVHATASGTTAAVSWTAPGSDGWLNISGYTLTATPTSGPPVTLTTSGSGTSATLTGLTALTSGSGYTITVAATNAAGTGAISAGARVGSFPTPWTPPTPPTSPVATPAPGVHRWGGSDRVATAVAISANLFPTAGSAPDVVITSSQSFADALPGARLASSRTAPLLLTPRAGLDASVAAEIRRVLAPGGRITVLGGEQALSPAVADALRALVPGYSVTRLGGEDRYATAVTIADAITTSSASRSGAAGAAGASPTSPIYLVTGTDFPDGLAVSPLAARTGGVLLLTDGKQLPPATARYLAVHDPIGVRTVTAGGPAAAARPGATSIVGADRYATARLIATRFPTTPTPGGTTPSTSIIGLATGQDWPDALTGSAAMGTLANPLLLTTPDHLSSEAISALDALNTAHRLTTGLVFGQTAAISTTTADAFATHITR